MLGHRSERGRGLAAASIAVLTGLAILLGLYHLLAEPLGSSFARYIPFAAFIALLALVPAALAWIGQLGPAPGRRPLLMLAGGVAVLIALGIVLGFALGFPDDYKAGAQSLNADALLGGTIGGICLLGFTAGTIFWFPKLTGRLYDERPRALPILTLGTILLPIGLHIAGQGNIESWSPAAQIGTSLALAAYLLVFLAAIGLLGGIALSARAGVRAGTTHGMPTRSSGIRAHLPRRGTSTTSLGVEQPPARRPASSPRVRGDRADFLSRDIRGAPG